MFFAHSAHILAENSCRAGLVGLKIMQRFQIRLHKSHDRRSIAFELAFRRCDRCVNAAKTHLLRASPLHVFGHTAKNQKRARIAEHSDFDAPGFKPFATPGVPPICRMVTSESFKPIFLSAARRKVSPPEPYCVTPIILPLRSFILFNLESGRRNTRCDEKLASAESTTTSAPCARALSEAGAPAAA